MQSDPAGLPKAGEVTATALLFLACADAPSSFSEPIPPNQTARQSRLCRVNVTSALVCSNHLCSRVPSVSYALPRLARTREEGLTRLLKGTTMRREVLNIGILVFALTVL